MRIGLSRELIREENVYCEHRLIMHAVNLQCAHSQTKQFTVTFVLSGNLLKILAKYEFKEYESTLIFLEGHFSVPQLQS